MNSLILLFIFSLLFGQFGALTPMPGVALYVHDFSLLVVLIISAWTAIRKKDITVPNLIVPIGVFVFAAVLSLAINTGRLTQEAAVQSSLYLIRWIFYAFSYAVIVQKWVRVSNILPALYGAGMGFALIGFVQYIWYPDLRNLSYLGWDPHYYRLFSTLLDPNFMGIVFVFSLLVGTITLRAIKQKALLVASQLVLLGALVLTFSRSSYLAFLAGFLCWIILQRRFRLLILLGVCILIFVFIPKPGGDTLSLIRFDSSIARAKNWLESMALITQSPVIGHGFNTLRYVKKSTDPNWQYSNAGAGLDSSLLFVGATTGIVGLFAYIGLLYSQIRIGLKLKKNKSEKIIRDAYIASIAALLVHSLFVNSLFYPWVMLWMWALTGIVERGTQNS